jgi:hypothetical protein
MARRPATKAKRASKPRAAPRARKRARIREAPPAPEQSQIDGRTADERYELRTYVATELVNDTITLLRGDIRVPGDLALDLDTADDDVPDGTIVDGDLDVTGSVINRDGELGAFLLVTGNLRAKNVIAGGAHIAVLGDLIVDDVIFGHSEHGKVYVGGTTHAKAIISEKHAFELRGRVEGITVSGRDRITDDDHFRSYDPVLVRNVLASDDESGAHPDPELTADAILAGRPVLRDDVVLN